MGWLNPGGLLNKHITLLLCRQFLALVSLIFITGHLKRGFRMSKIAYINNALITKWPTSDSSRRR